MKITENIKKAVRRLTLRRKKGELLNRFPSEKEILAWGAVYEKIEDELSYQHEILKIEGNNTATSLIKVFRDCNEYKKALHKSEQLKINTQKKKNRKREALFERSKIPGLTG